MTQVTASEQLKEKGSEVLVKMIDITVQSMSDVIEFSKQQIPEVIHQLLMWKATYAGVWMLIGVFLLTLAVIYGKKANGWIRTDSNNIPAHLLTVLLFTVGSYQFIDNLLIILQIWIAPKIYLIEYAASLVK